MYPPLSVILVYIFFGMIALFCIAVAVAISVAVYIYNREAFLPVLGAFAALLWWAVYVARYQYED